MASNPEPSLLRNLRLGLAGAWLGVSLFFTFVAGPAFFSPSILETVGREHSGAMAQFLIGRYFLVQLAMAAVALGLGFLASQRGCRALAGVILALILGIASYTVLVPEMKRLREVMYAGSSTLNAAPAIPLSPEAAKKRFGMLHGISQLMNLCALAGVMLHFGQLARSSKNRDKADGAPSR